MPVGCWSHPTGFSSPIIPDWDGLNWVWTETTTGGLRVITATKYPEAIAGRIIERRRRAALRGEDAA